MKRLIKIFGVILVALALLFVAWVAYAYYTFGQMRPDRGEAYQARVHYLPDPVPSTEFDMPGLEGWMKTRLHNAMMDKGPYIVAYPLPQGEPKKAIVILPGGAYVFRSEKEEGTDVAEWLNREGIAAFVLNYRLQRHPVPLSDVQAGIRYIRAHAASFNIRPDKLGVMGFSAGGHLAATSSTLFTAHNRPDFTVLAYPVINMEGALSHGSSRLSLVGPAPSPRLLETVSPHRQVTKSTPPAFIWAPETDTVVPWENAKAFADALDAQGVANELHIFPEGQHGSALAQDEEYASAWPALMLAWLNTL